MSTVENLGNTKTIRIGEASDQEVDNYSRKIAVIYNGETVPILGREGSYDEEGRHEIVGANKHTAVDAEVYENEIYLLRRAPVANVAEPDHSVACHPSLLQRRGERGPSSDTGAIA